MFYQISTAKPLSLIDKLQLGELTPKAAATFVEFLKLQDLRIKALPQCLEYLGNLGDVFLIKDKEGQRISLEEALNNQAGFCPESHYWVVSDEWGELPLTSLFIEWWKMSDHTTRRRFLKQVGVRFYPQLFISRIWQNYWRDYQILLLDKILPLLSIFVFAHFCAYVTKIILFNSTDIISIIPLIGFAFILSIGYLCLENEENSMKILSLI